MAKQKKPKLIQELTPEIIANAQAGDPKAIKQLLAWITNFVPSKIHVSSRRTRDQPSDISQEVTLKVIANLASFKGTTPIEFKNWVSAIARRAIGQSIRDASCDKRDINIEIRIETNSSEGMTAEQKSPSRMFADKEAVHVVLGILWNNEKVNAEQRNVIILRLLYKFSVTKVATRLKTTEASIDSRFRRGLEKLRRLYAAEVGEAPRKTTISARDKRAVAFLEYVRMCDAGKTVNIDAFLIEFGLETDGELRTLLEMIEKLREFNLEDDEDT